MRRSKIGYTPFMFITPFLIFGIIWGYYANSWSYFGIAFSLTAICSFIAWKLFDWSECIIATLFFALGFLIIFKDKPICTINYNEKLAYVTQITSNLNPKGRYQTAEGVVIAEKNNSIWGSSENNVLLYIDSSLNPNIGDVITYYSKSYDFDSVYKSYYYDKGIFARQYIYNFDLIGKTNNIGNDLDKFRQRTSNRIYLIDTSFKQATAIMSAVTVGDKSNLQNATKSDYRVTGVSHILAISGLHVGILYAIFNFILGWLHRFKYGRYIMAFTLLILLWSYAAISGFSPSVLRAVIMFSFFSVGECTFEKKNSLNILLASAFLILVVNPMSLFDIGFQLSYCAMVGIITLYNPISYLVLPKHKILKWAWSLFVITFTAQVATTPLVLYYFNQIGLLGFAVNYIVWFTIPIIIVTTLLFMLLNIHLIGLIGVYISEVQNVIIHKIAQTGFGVIRTTPFSKEWVMTAYLLLIILVLALNYIHAKHIKISDNSVFSNVLKKNV